MSAEQCISIPLGLDAFSAELDELDEPDAAGRLSIAGQIMSRLFGLR